MCVRLPNFNKVKLGYNDHGKTSRFSWSHSVNYNLDLLNDFKNLLFTLPNKKLYTSTNETSKYDV